MSFGYGVGDVMAISRLAFKVYTACKDAPDDYGNILDEVKSLHIVIDCAAQHFKSTTTTTLSDDNRQKGQEVLRGCQNLLEDLDSLIGKYSGLAPASASASASTSTSTSTSASQVLQRVRLGTGLVLGTEDITTLRARLTSNTNLLSIFIQSCDSRKLDEIQEHSHKLDEIQQRLDNILGLRRTTSRDSLVSLAGSINTKKAYKKLVKDLFAIGVTAAMINEKEKEIKGLFGPQQAVSSNPMDSSTSGDQDHHQSLVLEVGDSSSTAEASPIISSGNQHLLPELEYSSDAAESSPISVISKSKSRSRFSWARPPLDFLVGPRMLAAAEAGDAQLLTSVLRFVRNINFTNDWGWTALHKAAAGGHKDVVHLLLTRGASIEALSYAKNTPLHKAARRGHTSIVELLLTEGASVEPTNSSNDTPLHFAAGFGQTSTVELLLTRGASIEALNNSKNTPLHLAAGYGQTSTVELLLTRGASIEALNNAKDTPLHLAAVPDEYTSPSTIELLLAKGASVEAINSRNKTPLDLAKVGVPIELKDDSTARSNNASIIKLLENEVAKLGIPGSKRTVSGRGG